MNDCSTLVFLVTCHLHPLVLWLLSDSTQPGPLLSLRLNEVERYHTPTQTLTVYRAQPRRSIEMYLLHGDGEDCCCSPVTDGRLKRAVAREEWKLPLQQPSQHAHAEVQKKCRSKCDSPKYKYEGFLKTWFQRLGKYKVNFPCLV